jgi:hypothetical protein
MRLKHAVQTDSRKQDQQLAIPRPIVALDYPQDAETIVGPNYTFRISAPVDAQKVELSINKSPWQTCRHANGFWWFDCSDIARGPAQARARTITKDGKMKMTLLRRFQSGQ